MIEVKDLSVAFRDTEVLHKVSCTFLPGEITGLMGRNGSGKTVLLKAVCGMLSPASGSVIIEGKKLTTQNAHRFSIGALIETPGFLRHYSGLRNLDFLAALRGGDHVDRARRAMDIVGLDWREKKRVGAYSLGMKQKLGIAQAIMDDPDILILDEPMNGLDQASIAALHTLVQELAQQGKTVILASHYAEDLNNLCTHLYHVERGVLTPRPA